MTTKSFSVWEGPEGIKEYIEAVSGCKPYSGAGICPRIHKKTTILRSVDDTPYYKDDLTNVQNPKYTLFGHSGDQDENEKQFNEPLLNQAKTENIYLYRVTKDKKKKEYIWYGRYTIKEKNVVSHIGKDGNDRNIIVLTLDRCLEL